MIKKDTSLWMALVALLMLQFFSCGMKTAHEEVNALPPIFPDYIGVTIPPNIAPLNFEIKNATRVQAVIVDRAGTELDAKGSRYVKIDEKKWKDILMSNKGKELTVTVSVWNKKYPNGVKFKPFKIYVDDKEIDAYVAYRLLPLGYVGWSKMGIFQRNLSNFDEEPIVTNEQNEKGCVNCHTFCKGSAVRYMLHARGKGGGTVIVLDGKMEKINLLSMGPHKQGVYPAWHPGGRFIAFTTNLARQSFYSHCQDKVEVYDLESDLIVYDTQRHKVLADERFNDSTQWETFPTFSPDGKWLYFCTARARLVPYEMSKLHYSLVRVPFYATNGSLGNRVDTIYSAAKRGGSVSLPRISPDGRYLLLTWANYGTFHIQDRDADLMLVDLKTGKMTKPRNVNSEEAESFHSWSNNGRWVVFVSRRIDGRYSRLFIASFKNGKFGKPFLLPQRDPSRNRKLLYAFNVPEFVKSKVNVNKDEMAKLLR